MSRRLCFLVCFLLAATARAEEFAWEPSGFASHLEQDPLFEVDRSSLAFTHYFDPVDDAAGPYGLAAFLDPGTRVAAAVDHEKNTSNTIGGTPGPLPVPPALVTESDEYSVSGRYVF